MKCLIAAAGLGSRLRPLSESKPLTPVNGVALIEHVIRGAASGGASEFVIVTGHRAEQVESFLASLADRIGLPIQPVRTNDWTRPNGFSVVTGAELIEGDYLLLMADHLFDPNIIERLLRTAGRDRAVTLAVDRDVANPLIDLDDATKVQTDDRGAIIGIGKALEHYNAIDTGIFLATPAVRTAILDAVAQGRSGSLSDGMQLLADRGEAGTMDIDGAWWLDVDDPRSHWLAEEHFAAAGSALGIA